MSNLGLIEKITNLPPERVTEVEDFVDFLVEKDTKTHNGDSNDSNSGTVNLRDFGISEGEAAEQRAALSSFASDWDCPEMSVYDNL